MALFCKIQLLIIAISAADNSHKIGLSDFNAQNFWQRPPEGMFEVNVGLYGALELEGQSLM